MVMTRGATNPEESRLLPGARWMDETMIRRTDVRALLRSEILRAAGCTEPASVAYAFMKARRMLGRAGRPKSARLTLEASPEVLRNAATAVVPYLNRRGLRAVVAAGLTSRADRYNLFPSVDHFKAAALLRKRGWLKTRPVRGRKGIYIKATITLPGETVSVVIEGHHDEIRSISRNGRTVFRAPRRRERILCLEDIMTVARWRDRGMENIARDFLLRQVRGRPGQPLPERVANLVRARMLGSPAPIMTIVGSGNHGIFLGVPFYDLYRRQGDRILPAVVLALLVVIQRTAQRKRISAECGLGTKAAPALAAGLALTRGADLPTLQCLMTSISRKLCGMKCHGARSSCGRKAARALQTVLAEVGQTLSGGVSS